MFTCNVILLPLFLEGNNLRSFFVYKVKSWQKIRKERMALNRQIMLYAINMKYQSYAIAAQFVVGKINFRTCLEARIPKRIGGAKISLLYNFK